MKRLTPIAIILIIVALCASAGTRSPKREISNNLGIFNSLFKELQTYYVDSIDTKKSITTAINAMLDDIDPYTEYIPAEEQADFRSMTTGEYGGIGSYIGERGEYVIFTEPADESPAQRAGIRPGDRIIMIDSDSTRGWKSSQVSETLKGTAGTNVKVTVNRPYATDSILTFDITRAKIQMPSVPFYGTINDGKTGFITLTSFTDKSPKEVREALIDLKGRGIQNLILDLRSNGGGLLESAVQITNLFVPKGTEVLRTRGKGQLNEKIYKTTNQPIDKEIPLIVLIDGATASSSEIVSGALQDLDRAVIMGERSFGKGLVQTTRPLPFDGLLKVTIAKYYIPSGRLIQAIDYSHRNEDGSVSRIPDSLTTVYHTAAGREVRDGAGITPDVTVKSPDVNRLTYNVVAGNWIFDYVTKYAAAHPSVAAPEDFVVDDSIYADFKRFIDPSRLNYDKVCDAILNTLRTAATVEGYMNDSVKAQIDVLDKMLKHNLDQDLDISRKSIEPYLGAEIMRRYYSERGALRHALRYDATVDSALTILNDPERYKSILAPKAKK